MKTLAWFTWGSVILSALAESPLNRIEFREVLPSTGPLTAVAFGKERFVAVGTGGTVLASRDGQEEWRMGSTGVSANLSSVIFAQDRFVTVGNRGLILISDDASLWKRVDSGLQIDLQKVVYGNGAFVAMAKAGNALTVSTNATEWAPQFSPLNAGWKITDLAFGNGLFVAANMTNVLLSTDGSHWSPQPVFFNPLVVAFGNGEFLAADQTKLYSSVDGTNWTTRIVHGALVLRFAGGRFFAFPEGFGSGGFSSDDGILWSSFEVGPALDWQTTIADIAFGAGHYVAAVSARQQPGVFISDDGLNWSSVGARLLTSRFPDAPRTIAFEEGKFWTGGSFFGSHESFQPALLESTNGAAWNSINVRGELFNRFGFSGYQQVSGIAFGHGRIVAIASSLSSPNTGLSTVLLSSDGDWLSSQINLPLISLAFGNGQFVAVGGGGAAAVSPDGLTWKKVTSHAGHQLNSVTYANGKYVAAGFDGTVILSTNGLDWINVKTPVPTTVLFSVVNGAGVFVAVGSSGVVLRSADAVAWDRIPSGTTANLNNVAYGNGFFIAVGDKGTILLSTDGTTWTVKKVGSPSRTPLQFTGSAFGNGKIVVTGSSVVEANLAEGILSGPRLEREGFQFAISGQTDRIFRIQSTETLAPPRWRNVGSVTNNELTVPFLDPGKSGSAQRFYRVVTD